jgi:hypothetical protein
MAAFHQLNSRLMDILIRKVCGLISISRNDFVLFSVNNDLYNTAFNHMLTIAMIVTHDADIIF